MEKLIAKECKLTLTDGGATLVHPGQSAPSPASSCSTHPLTLSVHRRRALRAYQVPGSIHTLPKGR
jgi:hypothetical protein